MGLVDAFDAVRAPDEAVVLPGKADLGKLAASWVEGLPVDAHPGGSVMRASGMFFLCPREFVLDYWNPAQCGMESWVAQLRMSTGTHLHWWLQNCVLGPMGLLYGEWVDSTVPADTVPPPTRKGYHPDPERAAWELANQKRITWRYWEPSYLDTETRIGGHVDGFINRSKLAAAAELWPLFRSDPAEAMRRLAALPDGGKDFALLEIKTCGSFPYSKLKTAEDIPDYYKMQAEIYQHLSTYRETLFWFIERDSMSSKCLTYPWTGGWWKDAHRKSVRTWRAVRDRKLPDCFMACRAPTDKRAKQCPHRAMCWNLDGARGTFKTFAEFADKCVADDPGREWVDPATFLPEEE